jgi:hypothetical protein
VAARGWRTTGESRSRGDPVLHELIVSSMKVVNRQV